MKLIIDAKRRVDYKFHFIVGIKKYLLEWYCSQMKISFNYHKT